MKLIERYNAFFLDKASRRLEKLVAGYKTALFRDLRGTVVELGPGTGVNFPHLPRSIQWIGVEPNKELHRVLREHPHAPSDLTLVVPPDDGTLRIASNSADHVICTFVFCSVPYPERTMREIVRILKPGGTFKFMEHVAAPAGTLICTLQNLATPFTRTCAGNCHTNRRTDELIQNAAFSSVGITPFSLPAKRLKILFPCVLGRATK